MNPKQIRITLLQSILFTIFFYICSRSIITLLNMIYKIHFSSVFIHPFLVIFFNSGIFSEFLENFDIFLILLQSSIFNMKMSEICCVSINTRNISILSMYFYSFILMIIYFEISTIYWYYLIISLWFEVYNSIFDVLLLCLFNIDRNESFSIIILNYVIIILIQIFFHTIWKIV